MRVSACSYDRCFISSRKTSGGWRSSCTRRTCGLNSWSWRSKMWGTLKEASKASCASQKRSCVMNHAAEVRSPSLKSSHFCRNPCRRSQIWFELKLVTRSTESCLVWDHTLLIQDCSAHETRLKETHSYFSYLFVESYPCMHVLCTEILYNLHGRVFFFFTH